jgi:hypothetical protein
MPTLPLRLTLAAILLAGCGSATDPMVISADAGVSSDAKVSTPPPPASGSLPCAVAAVLAARCQSCHQSPALFGAPMPLLTWADTQAIPPKDTVPAWQAIKTKVSAGLMPPGASPSGAMTADEKATLMAWVEAGAPKGTGVCTAPGGGPVVTPPASGTEALPCTPRYEFRASDESPAKGAFAVPLASNTYQCFTFQVPFTAAEQAVAWAPIIDDARVVHHWILYGHSNTTRPTGCGDTGRVFLMGWAPGGQNGVMPPGVGLELPDPGSWLSLEVHYNNSAGYKDARDRSGVAMCTESTPRAQAAGVITLGAVGIAIPPGAQDYTITSEVPGLSTRVLPGPLHVLWTSPHMHVTGTSFRTDFVRASGTTPLVEVPAWDFANQRAFPQDPDKVIISPGDGLRTTCTYRNNTNATIRFGEKTENEMCFNFVVVYPIDGVSLRQWITR